MRRNPKIVSLGPGAAYAAAGLTPNRPPLDEVVYAMDHSPGFLRAHGISRWTAEDYVANRIGKGGFAHAFALPNGTVLKVTDDEDDAAVARYIMEQTAERGEPHVGLPRIFDVKELRVKSRQDEMSAWKLRKGPAPLYAIVMERANSMEDASFDEGFERAMGDVWAGVVWLESHGFTMRDLHRGNIGRTEDGRAVLIDFGSGSNTRGDKRPFELAENPGRPGKYVGYHGAARRFDRPTDFGKLRNLDFGPGFYFATDRGDAAGYGSNVYRVEIELKNPIFILFDEVDEALVKRLQRALRIDDEAMSFGREDGAHPIAYIFELVRTLVEVGQISPKGLRDYLVKIGYDGAIVDPEVVNDAHRRAGSSKADVAHSYYIAVFSPEQILSWERDVEGDVERARTRGLASNARRRGLPSARRIFDECFDVIDEMFPDFGSCELHHDEAAASDNGAGFERQYGYCMDGDPIVIAFAAKIEDAPEHNVRGLMRHEFGHALDFRYGKEALERKLGRRLPDGVERRADAIAEAVFGDPIEYDCNLVQCIDCGGRSPRPRSLPR